MAEQCLDDAGIDPVLEQMRGEGSPERLPWQAVEGLCRKVRSDPLGDIGRLSSFDDYTIAGAY